MILFMGFICSQSEEHIYFFQYRWSSYIYKSDEACFVGGKNFSFKNYVLSHAVPPILKSKFHPNIALPIKEKWKKVKISLLQAVEAPRVARGRGLDKLALPMLNQTFTPICSSSANIKIDSDHKQ
jgi:hypothetical protein